MAVAGLLARAERRLLAAGVLRCPAATGRRELAVRVKALLGALRGGLRAERRRPI